VLCFLVYFLLATGDLYKQKLVRLAGPQRRWKRLTLAVLSDIDAAVQRFLLIQVLTCTFVGLASWLAFAAFGLEQAPVWGLAAGVLNVVPYLGAAVVVGGVGIVSFLQFGSATTALAIAAVALAIQALEGAVLTPKLVGRASRMNDVAVFTSLLVWGWLWGFAGVLLAVPLMMVLKAVCDRIEDLQPLGELLGDG
jgi:predicted PurR-regulated permease PerM